MRVSAPSFALKVSKPIPFTTHHRAGLCAQACKTRTEVMYLHLCVCIIQAHSHAIISLFTYIHICIHTMLLVMRSALCSAKLCKPCSAPIDCRFCRNSALPVFIVLFGIISRAIVTVRPMEIRVFRKPARVLCTLAEAASRSFTTPCSLSKRYISTFQHLFCCYDITEQSITNN